MDLSWTGTRREAAWKTYDRLARALPLCEHVREHLTGDKARPALDRIRAADAAMCQHVREWQQQVAMAWYRFRRASQEHEALALAEGKEPYA